MIASYCNNASDRIILQLVQKWHMGWAGVQHASTPVTSLAGSTEQQRWDAKQTTQPADRLADELQPKDTSATADSSSLQFAQHEDSAMLSEQTPAHGIASSLVLAPGATSSSQQLQLAHRQQLQQQQQPGHEQLAKQQTPACDEAICSAQKAAFVDGSSAHKQQGAGVATNHSAAKPVVESAAIPFVNYTGAPTLLQVRRSTHAT